MADPTRLPGTKPDVAEPPADPFGILLSRPYAPGDEWRWRWQELANVGRRSFGVDTVHTVPRPVTVRPHDSWSTLGMIGEMSPVAAARDATYAIGAFEQARDNGDFWGMLHGLGTAALSMAAMTPTGVAAREATLLKEATQAAKTAGLATDKASRAQRLVDQGYTRGMWRGGSSVADGRWFTPDREAAARFARRWGPQADVREYALRFERPFDFGEVYGPETFREIARRIRSYNPTAAREFTDMARKREGIYGGGLYTILEHQSNGTDALLARLGYDSIRTDKEVKMLDMRKVRDAEKGMFNPASLDSINPFASLLPPALTFGAFYPSATGGQDAGP